MKREPLTAYEEKVAQRIAEWKGRRPGLLSRAIETLKWPLDRGLKAVIPGDEAARLLAKLNASAEWKVGYDLIRREAGVDELVQLRTHALEHCDRLERRVELADAGVVTSESLLAGVGGLATEIASIPAEVLLALKSVHRVAGCYGYPLNGTQNQTLVLAVIGLSMIDEAEDRVRWCEKIRAFEYGQGDQKDPQRLGGAIADDVRSEVIDEVVEELGTSVLEQALGGSVPLLGTAIGVVLDNRFIREVESTARCVFQERWLKDNGKIDEIAPVEGQRGVFAALSQVAYATGYAAGFGVVFPVTLTARAAEYLLPQPGLDGLKDGAASAKRQVERLFADHSGDLSDQLPVSSRPPNGTVLIHSKHVLGPS
jgi:hypothetical protein